jgi:hypothetical protein
MLKKIKIYKSKIYLLKKIPFGCKVLDQDVENDVM